MFSGRDGLKGDKGNTGHPGLLGFPGYKGKPGYFCVVMNVVFLGWSVPYVTVKTNLHKC